MHWDLFALTRLLFTAPGGDGVHRCQGVVHFIYTPSVQEAQRRRLHIGTLDGVSYFQEQELTKECSGFRTRMSLISYI
jgi:hypothetical protein